MPEFGANLPGFAFHDPEVDNMFDTYRQSGCCYFVCEENGQIVGGAGLAPLKGATERICELQKMYFLPAARGKSYGKQLLKLCFREAITMGYEQMYIETLHSMESAIRLYESNGFKQIPASLGSTGHFGCDKFYAIDLKDYFAGRNM